MLRWPPCCNRGARSQNPAWSEATHDFRAAIQPPRLIFISDHAPEPFIWICHARTEAGRERTGCSGERIQTLPFCSHLKDEALPPFHRRVEGGATVWNSIVHRLFNASVDLLSKQMV